MKKRLLLATTLLTCAILGTTDASAFEIGKPIKASIQTSKKDAHGTPVKKEIYLMNFKLTPAELRAMLKVNPRKHAIKSETNNLPSSVNLGMNGVPVLDQGAHGACVTFANTAAIDAVLGHSDYISQLCQLELGSYLENETYLPSGWNGSLGPWVLDQMMRYGIISQDKQKMHSCADIRQYPIDNWRSEGNPMNEDAFKELSENLSYRIYYAPIMNAMKRLDVGFVNDGTSEEALIHIKQALSIGHRVTFGTFLAIGPYCNAGACASYHTSQDTWALTKEIDTPPYFTAGHEMVITGYDDNAVAVDAAGNSHQGLLTLRNSWGDDAGDKGDFYMTYDYFRKFALEAQEIAPLQMNIFEG